MAFGLEFVLRNFCLWDQEGETPTSFSVSITGASLDSIGSYGRIGTTLTVSDFGTFDSVQWTRDGVPIAGATGETYTLVGADDETVVRCEGTQGATTIASSGLSVRYIPGTAAVVGSQNWEVGDVIDLSVAASGNAGPFSYITTVLPAGLSLSGENLVGTLTDDFDATVVVTPTDKYGRDLDPATSFAVVVTEPSPIVLNELTWQSSPEKITFTDTSENGAVPATVYHATLGSGYSITDAEQVISAGGTGVLERVSYAYSGAVEDLTGDLTSASDSKVAIATVVVDTEGRRSNVYILDIGGTFVHNVIGIIDAEPSQDSSSLVIPVTGLSSGANRTVVIEFLAALNGGVVGASQWSGITVGDDTSPTINGFESGIRHSGVIIQATPSSNSFNINIPAPAASREWRDCTVRVHEIFNGQVVIPDSDGDWDEGPPTDNEFSYTAVDGDEVFLGAVGNGQFSRTFLNLTESGDSPYPPVGGTGNNERIFAEASIGSSEAGSRTFRLTRGTGQSLAQLIVLRAS